MLQEKRGKDERVLLAFAIFSNAHVSPFGIGCPEPHLLERMRTKEGIKREREKRKSQGGGIKEREKKGDF